MRKITCLALLIFMLFSGCIVPTAPDNADAKNLQDTLVFGANTLILDSYLLRNYMPSASNPLDTSGSALRGSVSIYDINGDSILTDPGFDSIWIGYEQVSRPLSITGFDKRDSLIECSFQDSVFDVPAGIRVTVVVRLQYPGIAYYLREKNVLIWKAI